MGEYATINGNRIKIGTCESMYYLRYEDRYTVAREPHSLDPARTPGLRWRLPFPDEDNMGPGGYADHSRGLRLARERDLGNDRTTWDDFPAPEGVEAGTMQLTHPSGLLLNVPCHHGARLPDVHPTMGAFWNGKNHAIELLHVKNMPDGAVLPVIGCRHCGDMWRSTWDEVLPYVFDEKMRARLSKYATAEV